MKQVQNVDILAIGVHPDDVELSCSGTLMRHLELGHSVGILDLTRGELGTRGNPELRKDEAYEAASLLGVSFRSILNLNDGFFQNVKEEQIEIIKMIRAAQPKIILANSISDRHPDHGRAAQLVKDAAFYSGLRKIETEWNGVPQNSWRPEAVYHYIQDYFLIPDLVVDISAYMERKMIAIKAFKSQFYSDNSDQPESPISGKDFFNVVQSRDKSMGRYIGVAYAEGFKVSRPLGVNNLLSLT